MKIGANEVDDFKLGATQVDALYQGTEKVWPLITPFNVAVITPANFTSLGELKVTSTSGFDIDWGDGNFITYATGNLIAAQAVPSADIILRGKDITAFIVSTQILGVNFDITDISIVGTTLTSGRTVASHRSLITATMIDSGNIQTWQDAFNNCVSLNSVSIDSTVGGTVFRAMFMDCSQLNSLPALDTSNGTNFVDMFSGCFALICLTSVNTINQTVTSGMFTDTPNLVAPTAAEQNNILVGFDYVNPGACP